MKKFLTILAVLLAFLASETFAKSRSTSRSFSKPSTSSYSKPSPSKSYTAPVKKRTSTWGNKKKATVSKTTTAVATTAVASTTNDKAKTTVTAEKPKAVSTSKLDSKLTKKTASSPTAKKYTSKAQAETAARTELASKNNYTSSTRPSTRPAYIPQRVSRNGRSYDTDYYRMPNGTYGYGYRDPSTGLIVSLLAADMMMDAAYMRNNGYDYGPAVVHTPRRTHTTHVVHHGNTQSTPISTMGWIFIFVLFGAISALVIWMIRRES